VGVAVGVGVVPGIGVGVGVVPGDGVPVGVGVAWLSTMRRGEMTQPVRLNSNAAPAKYAKTVLNGVSLYGITL